MLKSAVIASTLALAVYAGNIALGPVPDQIISWTIDSTNTNITFDLLCKMNKNYGNLSWCAFGINTANSTGMAPAAIMWLSVNDAGAANKVEDRVITQQAEPECSDAQISYTISSKYDKTSGNLMATVTRPLKISDAAKSQGLTDITDNIAMLLGANAAGVRTSKHCAMGHTQHYGVYNDVGTNFMAN